MGTPIFVIVITVILLVITGCIVFAGVKIYFAAKEAGVFDENPVTDIGPLQTESSQTTQNAVQTEPAQSETSAEAAVPRQPVVCVDAGHGYDDPGTDSTLLGEYSEKDITLDIALKLGKILGEMGYMVKYTRTDDIVPEGAPLSADGRYTLNPYGRAEYLADNLPVDAFVSVHCNSYETDPKINGAKVYYYKYNTDHTDLLAQDIAYGIDHFTLTQEEIQSGRGKPEIISMQENEAYYVIKNTLAPSVLIETGFVTNEADAADMLDENWRYDIARGIADGLANYFKTVKIKR